MKKSSKAALQSGLIFPGIGHMVLNHYLRGSVLMLSALVAVSIIVKSLVQRAMTLVDRINSGEIIDTGSVADMVLNSSSGATGFTEKIALVVLVICWLAGIIDSYRLGAAEDNKSASHDERAKH